MDDPTPGELLDRTSEAAQRTARLVRAYWLPQLLFGSLSVIGAVVAMLLTPTHVGVVWLVGAPLAMLATAFWSRGRSESVGVAPDPRPYVIAGVGIFAGATILGFLGRGSALSLVGPLLVVAVGYLAFSRLARSRLVAAMAVALAVGALALSVSWSVQLYSLVTGLLGSGAIGLGAWNWFETARSAHNEA